MALANELALSGYLIGDIMDFGEKAKVFVLFKKEPGEEKEEWEVGPEGEEGDE